MAGNALHFESWHLNNPARVNCFILILEQEAFFFRIIPAKTLEGVLTAVIQGNDNISFRNISVTLDNDEIIFFDTGIHHRIALGS